MKKEIASEAKDAIVQNKELVEHLCGFSFLFK